MHRAEFKLDKWLSTDNFLFQLTVAIAMMLMLLMMPYGRNDGDVMPIIYIDNTSNLDKKLLTEKFSLS